MSETAYDAVNRQSRQVVGTVFLDDAGAFVRFEPKPAPKPAAEDDLYRIIWWQSLIVGMADGETLEEDVPFGKINERCGYWRMSLAGAVGVMIGSAPMSFVPRGDTKPRDE